MATFNQEAVEFITEAEASAIVDEATLTGSAAVEHDVLIDSVQVLALGGLSLDDVIGTGIVVAKQAGGYKKGTKYDFFTSTQRAYGEWVSEKIAALKPTDSVQDLMVFTGGYSVGRTSLTLISDMITPALGDSYFEVEFENYLVSSGTVTTRNTNKVIGLRGAIELYVHNLESGMFYFLENGKKVGVYLGDQRVYTTALTAIQASGILDSFHATLQTINPVLARELRKQANKGASQYNAAKQKLFLNVIKAIKPLIVRVGSASKTTN
jgi:hypothetical protein